MTASEKILSGITDEAKAKADEITADAEKKAEALIDAAKTEAEKEALLIKANAEKKAELIRQTGKSSAALVRRDASLKCKRELIEKAIEETGYAPSVSAQNVRTKVTKLIGVILPKLSSETILSPCIPKGFATAFTVLKPSTCVLETKTLSFPSTLPETKSG